MSDHNKFLSVFEMFFGPGFFVMFFLFVALGLGTWAFIDFDNTKASILAEEIPEASSEVFIGEEISDEVSVWESFVVTIPERPGILVHAPE